MAPDRCIHCGARYAAMRLDDGVADVAAPLDPYGMPALTRGALLTEDDAAQLGAGAAMVRAGEAKRRAWEAAHGPGRCVADESSFTGRVSLAAVLLGWPDTAAILAGIPEPITDDESRTIWCALPVGPAPNPPSLASILLEQLAGDAGAADAFDELDHLRSAGGIPSAWG